MNKGNNTDDGEASPPKYPFHEFMVDFLGGLVPGSLFIIGSCLAILPAIYLIFRISAKTEPATLTTFLGEMFIPIQNTPNMIWIALFTIFMAISYVLGHLFYRRDPKKPDRKSFVKISKKLISEQKALSNDFNETKYLKEELGCTSIETCEFPYPNLGDYLEKRGHRHLCSFVVWDKNNEDFDRSKTFINLLKIRLRHHYPQKCSVIIRNEAHIRLAASSWYVSYALSFVFVLGVLLTIFAYFLSEHVFQNAWQNPYTFVTFIPFLVPPTIVFIGAIYIKMKIESFIHYQRLREVFYVLETAFTAFRRSPELLKPPFSEYNPASSIKGHYYHIN